MTYEELLLQLQSQLKESGPNVPPAQPYTGRWSPDQAAAPQQPQSIPESFKQATQPPKPLNESFNEAMRTSTI
jgi:hypothetical protein